MKSLIRVVGRKKAQKTQKKTRAQEARLSGKVAVTSYSLGMLIFAQSALFYGP
jgi:hypothetical protein